MLCMLRDTRVLATDAELDDLAADAEEGPDSEEGSSADEVRPLPVLLRPKT